MRSVVGWWISFRSDSQTTQAAILADYELGTKSEQWKGKLRLARDNVGQPPSKTVLEVLLWTCRSQQKYPSR